VALQAGSAQVGIDLVARETVRAQSCLAAAVAAEAQVKGAYLLLAS
jgi:hypothetical protein